MKDLSEIGHGTCKHHGTASRSCPMLGFAIKQSGHCFRSAPLSSAQDALRMRAESAAGKVCYCDWSESATVDSYCWMDETCINRNEYGGLRHHSDYLNGKKGFPNIFGCRTSSSNFRIRTENSCVAYYDRPMQAILAWLTGGKRPL